MTSDELVRRAARPETLDVLFGLAAIVLVLEATRRTTGWALPAICLAFLLYAFFGGLLPDWPQIAHKGYGVDRIVGQSYMGLEGIFGVPLDVAATYIVLFAIYGAVLEFSGAARFFVEISFAAFGRSRTGPGRTSAWRASCSAPCPAPASPPPSRSAASPGRCCARPDTPRTRAAASWPRPASARSSRRRRSAPPRSSSPRCSRSATCRCWSTRWSRRSSTTSAS